MGLVGRAQEFVKITYQVRSVLAQASLKIWTKPTFNTLFSLLEEGSLISRLWCNGIYFKYLKCWNSTCQASQM